MTARRRLLDDVARLATGTAGLMQGAGREAEMLLRTRLERVLDRMDLVPRDEFEAVKAVAAAARTESELLADRVSALEAAIQVLQGGGVTAKAPAATRKPRRTKPAAALEKKPKTT